MIRVPLTHLTEASRKEVSPASPDRVVTNTYDHANRLDTETITPTEKAG